MDQNGHFGTFWPEEVHFGPFRSANRALAIPDLDAKKKRHLDTNRKVREISGRIPSKFRRKFRKLRFKFRDFFSETSFSRRAMLTMPPPPVYA